MADALTRNPLQPSGKTPLWGLLLMVSASLGATLILGWIYALLTQSGDLIFFGPLIAGVLLGLVIRSTVKPARCRNPRLVVAIAAICGLLLIGSRLYFASQDMYANQIPAEIAKEENISMDEAQQVVKQFQAKKGPVGSFLDYIQMSADSGFNIESSGSYHAEQSGSAISGGGYYFFLILDFVVAAFMVVVLCANTYAPGYCEKCDHWYDTQKLGMADVLAQDALLAAVGRRDWDSLSQLQRPVVGQPKGTSYLLTLLHACKDCDAGYLEVSGHTSIKGREQNVSLGAEFLSNEEVASARKTAR